MEFALGFVPFQGPVLLWGQRKREMREDEMRLLVLVAVECERKCVRARVKEIHAHASQPGHDLLSTHTGNSPGSNAGDNNIHKNCPSSYLYAIPTNV